MTDKSNTKLRLDSELEANVAAFRRRSDARIAEIKRDLQHHLDQITRPVGDDVVVMKALLEMACESYLELHEDPVEAEDLILRGFRRVVKRRNGSLQ
jgi:hypothetical protein